MTVHIDIRPIRKGNQRDSIVYPLVRLRGVVAEKKIVKGEGNITERKESGVFTKGKQI